MEEVKSEYHEMLDRIRQKAAGRSNIIPIPQPEDAIQCS